MNIQVSDTPAELAQVAANTLVDRLQAAITTHGTATWVIAGGSTPNAAYRILAEYYADAVDWAAVSIVIGDERCVPLDSPDSNWSVAKNLLLDHIPVSSDRLFRPISDETAEEAAADYQRRLARLPTIANGAPRLDVVWLGMGEDGHTLSLFPNHPSSGLTDELVIAVHASPKPPPDRISLTLPALSGTVAAFVLAAGASKADPVAQAVQGDLTLPIAQAADHIARCGGQVTWLLDQASAAKL